MNDTNKPIPTQITLNKRSCTIEIVFSSGEHFILPCAYLRAHSLSAEMRHGAAAAMLPPSSYQNVNILAIEAVGQYAIKPIFSDGHATGIYSWDTLYSLGKQYQAAHDVSCETDGTFNQ